MGNITMIKILLMKAANIEIEEEHKLTPLNIAVIQGHTKTMRLDIPWSQDTSSSGGRVAKPSRDSVGIQSTSF